MFRLRKPSEQDVRGFISQQQDSAFSYPEVGASANDVPNRYNVDRNRVLLGGGETTWHRAREAIRGWQMFNIPWLRLYWPTTPIEVGATVAISVEHFEFHSLNAARIVYVVDDDGSAKAINKLNGHKLWETKVGTLAAASPALGIAQNLVFVPILSVNRNAGASQNPGNGQLVALSMKTGRVAWSRSWTA